MQIRELTGHRSADEGMRPGDELHDRIKTRLLRLIEHAEEEAQVRADTYDDLEMLYLNYADPDAVSDDGGSTNPHKRSIVVPATYAAVQTLAAHIFATWTSRSVLLPLQALPPEHDRAAEALEAVLEAKHIQDGTAIKWWAWIMDALKYGQGRMVSTWGAEHEDVVETVAVPMSGALGLLLPPPPIQRLTRRLRKEGPVNYNIPPRDYLPDPSVPSWDPQAGQFVCIKSRQSRSSLWQQQGEGVYFNINRIARGGDSSPYARGQDDVEGQVPLSRDSSPIDTDDIDYVDLVTVYVKLIPTVWGLGDKSMPEIWVFVLANKEALIRAEPLKNSHGKFPVAVMDGNIDVHALYSPSQIEVVKGLQEHLDFLYNARQANIRLGLYMAFLYDPRFVEEEDIMAAQPGLRMRLKPEAMVGSNARSMSDVIHQLQVSDVTASVLGDIQLQEQMIQKALGAPDLMHGMPEGAPRTATEMGGVIQHARSRAGQLGALMWGQGVMRLGEIEIADTQQFLSEAGYYRLAGEAARRWALAGGRALIGRPDVQGQIQVAPVDVTMPVHREQLGQMWMQFAMGVAQNPMLSAKYNADEMFEEAARLMGAKNIEDFKRRMTADQIQTQVMPDAQVAQQVQAGNLVPAGAMGAGAPAAAMGAGPPAAAMGAMGAAPGAGPNPLALLMQAAFGGGR